MIVSKVTFVERLLGNRAAVMIMSAVPAPLPLLRRILQRDNARENRKDSWQRLRDDAERARYDAVRAMVERYAGDGFVLDIGCSQGILAEGLRYRRYLGVDNYADSVRVASAKADDRTDFVCGDAETFVPDVPADAVVLNEVLYYLADPLQVVRHHATSLTDGGVVVVSVFAHAWSTRRLLRQIAAELEQVGVQYVRSGHLAWLVTAYRPRAAVLPELAPVSPS